MENKLQQKYKGRMCSYTYPGYKAIYGKVDEISLQYLREPTVVIQINDKRYTCSLESVPDCLKLLTNDAPLPGNW